MNGCSSVTNALWARGLRDFADLCEWLGNEGSARWARSRHDAVRTAFEVFWDEGRGVYIDHIVDGEKRREAAQHPGAMAIVAGLVPDDRMARVIAGITDRRRLIRHSFVMDRLTIDGDGQGFVYLMNGFPSQPPWDVENQMVEAEPFFQHIVHEAMVTAGRADLVVESCRLWQVFVDAGETTWPECWVGGTRCHGWSSTPTADLVRYVLGITPAEPGYASVRVSPALGDLEWARATVPTPHGWITVEAHADGRLHIDSPVPVVGA
jgi:alpha-L-rhamnosidase